MKSGLFNSSAKSVGKLCEDQNYKYFQRSLSLCDFLLISFIDVRFANIKAKIEAIVGKFQQPDQNISGKSCLSDDLTTNIQSAMTVLTFKGLI